MENENYFYTTSDGKKVYSTERNMSPEERDKLRKEQEAREHKTAYDMLEAIEKNRTTRLTKDKPDNMVDIKNNRKDEPGKNTVDGGGEGDIAA